MITSDSDLILLDSNILIYAADESSPFHESSRAIRDSGVKGEVALCLSPQVLIEFYAVITDHRRVNNPLATEQAIAELEKYYSAKCFTMIYPTPEMIQIFLELLQEHNISRQEVFDLQLVATMFASGVKRIATYNHSHFRKFEPDLEIIVPEKRERW